MKQLTIQFDTPLKAHEVAAFRGAVNQSMDQANILFHNHTETGVRYAYPLIQYKCIDQKAAIVCINEGLEAIQHFVNEEPLIMAIGRKSMTFKLGQCVQNEVQLGMQATLTEYRLSRWLPLNSDNYKKYNQTASLIDKIKLLEDILVGNILAFHKGVDCFLQDKVACQITQIDSPRMITYKKQKVLEFDIAFTCNMLLPPYIGLGKHASQGYGVVTKK